MNSQRFIKILAAYGLIQRRFFVLLCFNPWIFKGAKTTRLVLMTNETALKPDLFTLTKSNLVVQYWSEGVLSILQTSATASGLRPHCLCCRRNPTDPVPVRNVRLHHKFSCACGAPYLHLARSTKLPVSNHRGKSPQYMLTDAPNRKPDWNGLNCLNTSFSFKSSNKSSYRLAKYGPNRSELIFSQACF